MKFDALKSFMDYLTSWRIPGNSVSVCINNNEVFNYQSGYADLENQIKMTSDKLFNIYSCSKVTTVTAALQLYEKGYFLLDDPLYDFIPAFKEMYIRNEEGVREKAKNPITLRHLFTMTSGLTYNMETLAIKEAVKNGDGKAETLDIVNAIAKASLSFEPGTAWQYSLSHDVLAGVVEVISGKKFRNYVKENIFTPLGMNESYYSNELVKGRMAEQYKYINGKESDLVKLQSETNNKSAGNIINVGKDVENLVLSTEHDSGGAGITTSVGDYSKLASALANFGLGASGERILSKGTVELLRTNQLNSPELSKNFNWSQLKGYGYGLGVRTLIDKAKSGSTGNLGEFGWGGAAGATVLVDPDIGLSVFYTHHMLNPHEEYYQPRLRNVVYNCIYS
ncbi:MAG: beta-lactamase family protein [Clostridia bacterium]|nr:beta-lactamase family protein [Clostridia bacterium]